MILEARQDAWTQARQASENLRLALSRDIARNLAVYDLSLRGVIDTLGEPGIDQASPGVRRHAIFDTSASAQDLGAILVINAAGQITEDSTSPVPHQADLSIRDYFRVHRDRADVGLYISRPYRSLIADGDLRISLSRRLPAPDGRFIGIVGGSLRLAFFERMFSQLDIGPHGVIALIRDDGRVLARYPFGERDVDRDLSQSAAFRRFSSADHGQFVTKASTDGVERLYTFGRVPGVPLILAVNRATEDILASWWERTLLITPVLFVLFTAAVASSLLFRREILRRSLAEAQLRKAADELAALATTDGLTGISNRRAFDVAFDMEWRRAIRDRTSPISILMIDVDYFKAFNDQVGHQEGDRVLRSVASCLLGKVSRAGDLVARFGGEEFVVLLPVTDHEGAVALAERMRLAVTDLTIGHPGSLHGRITVSIGVASCRPLGGETSSDLIKAADLALYAAKRAGRNQVKSQMYVSIEVPA